MAPGKKSSSAPTKSRAKPKSRNATATASEEQQDAPAKSELAKDNIDAQEAASHDSTAKPEAERRTGRNDKSVKKRKPAEPADEPRKAARRSGRHAEPPSKAQLLDYLLSKAAEELCRPDDESAAIKERGELRTYSSSVLNPFEELTCAVILSRPISHRLGLRSIRTILNEPYNFSSAKAVQGAGKEKHHQALYDAKTQHKGKTADEIGLIADVVLEKFTTSDDEEGTQLQRVLDDCENDIDSALDVLKTNIKGLGKTGLDIFLRRVQWIWTAGYPFADGRSVQSLKKLGLPSDAEELQKAIEENWSKLETKHLAGDSDEAKKRRALVIVLERATGADLEGKEDALLEAATAS